jgi:hypothetical protein
MRFKNMQVVSKQKAMSGDLPDFGFEMLFGLTVGSGGKEIEYSVEQPEQMANKQGGQLEVEELEKMPFVCLNNSGRSN